MVRVIAIGRLRGGPEADLFDRYTERLRPRPALVELPEARGAPQEVKRRESDSLLAALPRDALVVALDLGGEQHDSTAFARLLERWTSTGREPCFLIGGAEGLDRTVLARADYCLSFGTMTWPHFMVRGMLVEQLYRAQCIIQGHPYHRSGRP